MTPDDYADYGRSFPLCLNLAATDISKRKVGDAVRWRARRLGWAGYRQKQSQLRRDPERRMNRRARRRGSAEPFPEMPDFGEYRIYDSRDELPDHIACRPGFVPGEVRGGTRPGGYALGCWAVLWGSGNRCTRHYVVGSSRRERGITLNQGGRAVPSADLRRRRRELGFDYRKIRLCGAPGKDYSSARCETEPPGRPRIDKSAAEGAAQSELTGSSMLSRHGYRISRPRNP